MNKIVEAITVTDRATLVTPLNAAYNRRTLKAITLSDKTAYNNELLMVGENSLFWVIKKLLDKLGIE